ncbi:MAG: hypothetical protein J7499_10410 [Sphingopyxis sp.]|nr:hypothetical protein [Sphingopyxis sp.]
MNKATTGEEASQFGASALKMRVGAAVGALLQSTAGAVLASWRWRNAFDELNWQIGLEDCLWAFCLSWVVLSLRAAAGFFGFGATLNPSTLSRRSSRCCCPDPSSRSANAA